MAITCDICAVPFSTRKNLNRHFKTKHSANQGVFECQQCSSKFNRRDYLTKHIKAVHNFRKPVFRCSVCKEEFTNIRHYEEHKNSHVRSNEYVEIDHAFRRTCTVLRKVFPFDQEGRVSTLSEFYVQNQDQISTVLQQKLLTSRNFKVNMVIAAELHKNSGNEENRATFFFRTKATEVWSRRDVARFMHSGKTYLNTLVDDFLTNGSGWQLNAIDYCDLEVGDCPALAGSCSDKGFVIKKPKDILKCSGENIEAKKNGCLLYAVASYFTKSEDMKVLNSYIQHNINVKVKLPVKIRSLTKFEKDNQHLKFRINVFQMDEKRQIFPLRATKDVAENVINILWTRFE